MKVGVQGTTEAEYLEQKQYLTGEVGQMIERCLNKCSTYAASLAGTFAALRQLHYRGRRRANYCELHGRLRGNRLTERNATIERVEHKFV